MGREPTSSLKYITLCDFKIGTLSKPQRRRQRGQRKTKDLLGRTIA